MNLELVKIADVVLCEGYLLYPYCVSGDYFGVKGNWKI